MYILQYMLDILHRERQRDKTYLHIPDILYREIHICILYIIDILYREIILRASLLTLRATSQRRMPTEPLPGTKFERCQTPRRGAPRVRFSMPSQAISLRTCRLAASTYTVQSRCFSSSQHQSLSQAELRGCALGHGVECLRGREREREREKERERERTKEKETIDYRCIERYTQKLQMSIAAQGPIQCRSLEKTKHRGRLDLSIYDMYVYIYIYIYTYINTHIYTYVI